MNHSGHTAELEAFFRQLLDKSARQRLPELIHTPPADALYHVANREGVSVVALRTTSLSRELLLQIMTYRLAQYVLLGYLNLHTVYETGLDHESLESVAPNDVHVIAGSADSGEILCYMAIKAGPEASPGTTLRTRERPLFPVEHIYGWGVYNRLRILPDLPVGRLRELQRFVKNQQRHVLDELNARAPVEVVLAVFGLLAGRLAPEVEACIGDMEEGVAKKNLEFFHIPTVVTHGVMPYVAADAYPLPAYQDQTRYPFALLCSDIPLERLTAIENALAQPGKEGLAVLLQLKANPMVARSSLEPPEGLAPLTDAAVPQQGVPMEIRHQLLDVGQWLRTTDIFHGLCVAEAAVLGTFLQRGSAAAGETIIHQGDAGNDMYLIETGQAEVQVASRTGQRMVVATLGPGTCFGEIALVTGGERTADVIALTPMSLLRLSREAYARYLTHMVEVDNQLTHTALERTRRTLRAVRADEK